jgi:hypothetical protein
MSNDFQDLTSIGTYLLGRTDKIVYSRLSLSLDSSDLGTVGHDQRAIRGI